MTVKIGLDTSQERIDRFRLHFTQTPEIFDWGVQGQGVWGRKSPSGVQGQSPGRGSGDKVPQKLKHF